MPRQTAKEPDPISWEELANLVCMIDVATERPLQEVATAGKLRNGALLQMAADKLYRASEWKSAALKAIRNGDVEKMMEAVSTYAERCTK